MTMLKIGDGPMIEVKDVAFEFNHDDSKPIGNLEYIKRTDTSVEATVKLTRAGRKFYWSMLNAHGEAAKAGYEVYHAGRGRYKLRAAK